MATVRASVKKGLIKINYENVQAHEILSIVAILLSNVSTQTGEPLKTVISDVEDIIKKQREGN